jgi:ribose-phosphate pyrophosphokinase
MINEGCEIIADPAGRAWEFANKIYNNLNARNKNYHINPLTTKIFPDGEIKIKINECVRGKHCFFIHDSSLNPSVWLTELLLVNETLRNSSAGRVVNVLTYLDFSRQDRKDESRVPVSTRMLAKHLEVDADEVLTMDVHNPSTEAAYRIPFDNLKSFPVVVDQFKLKYPLLLENLVVISPDAGGAGRAQSFASWIGCEDIAIGYKTRSKEGEVKQLRIAGDVAGRRCIIIDDIIDSGGTLLKANEVLRKNGASEVYVYATHAMFTKGTEHLIPYFDRIFVSDTISNPKIKDNPKIEVISVDKMFAEAIHRINEGRSLSQLYTKPKA